MLLFCGGDGLFFWWEIRVGEIKKRAESGEDSLQKERKKRLKIKYGRRSIRRARVENTREKRTREKKADSLSTSFLWDQGEANGTCSRAPFPIIFSLYF